MNKGKIDELELIKEIEELKIKQKILIDNLRNKKIDKYEKLLEDIKTKLDFLVKLITDANADTENYTEELENKIVEKLNKKLDEFLAQLDEKLSDKFEEVEIKLSSLDNKLKITNDVKDNSSLSSTSNHNDSAENKSIGDSTLKELDVNKVNSNEVANSNLLNSEKSENKLSKEENGGLLKSLKKTLMK